MTHSEDAGHEALTRPITREPTETSGRGEGAGVLAQYQARSLSESSRRAYAKDLKAYQSRGGQWPPDIHDLLRFVRLCGEEGHKRSTIKRRLAGIQAVVELTGNQWPLFDRLNARAIAGALREHVEPHKPNRSAAAMLSDLRAMLEAIEGDRRTAVRDRAMLLLMWVCALRSADLQAIRIRDLERRTHGYVLHILTSKTDQTGKGVELPVPIGRHELTCPVRNLDRLLLDLVPYSVDMPAFQTVRHNRWTGRAISRRSIRRNIKARAKAAGLSGRYSGHSLRAGFASQGAEAGVGEHRIRSITRHRSSEGLRPYIRDGKLFVEPVAQQLGI